MTDWMIVGAGGVLGSLARFELGRIVMRRYPQEHPVSTSVINISGAILLGIVTGLPIKHTLFLLLADGFLGAYTTFSTFMYEGFSLLRRNKKRNACVYIFGTILLGIAGYGLGYGVCRWILK